MSIEDWEYIKIYKPKWLMFTFAYKYFLALNYKALKYYLYGGGIREFQAHVTDLRITAVQLHDFKLVNEKILCELDLYGMIERITTVESKRENRASNFSSSINCLVTLS